jgi:hypothetical protein
MDKVQLRSNYRRRALLVRVRQTGDEKWMLCGSSCSLTAEVNGNLEFPVNDQDDTDNSDSYRIAVTRSYVWGQGGLLFITESSVVEVEGGLRAISRPQPAYPKEARAAHVAGLVFVRLIIDETGKVTISQSLCGPAALSEAAETAARN